MKYLEVKNSEIKYNLNTIEQYIENENKKQNKEQKTKIIAVVKCNMYGFGMIQFSHKLKELGITDFAVSDENEALTLRNSGIDSNIYLLTPVSDEKSIKELIQQDIILTIGSYENLKQIDEITRKIQKAAKVSVKIDTGFSRYGILYSNEQEIQDTYRLLDSLKNVNIVSTFSHFSESYSNSNFTNLQYERFMKVVDLVKQNQIDTGIIHIANSNAIFKSSKYFLDAVRLGSCLLGRTIAKNNLNLKRIGTLKVKIEQIKELPSNSYIGYSRTFKTKKPTKIAILPIGYCDGVFLQTPKETQTLKSTYKTIKCEIKKLIKKSNMYVEIKGKKCNILGKIGTKFMICDITNMDVSNSDEAIIRCSFNYLSLSLQRRYI